VLYAEHWWKQKCCLLRLTDSASIKQLADNVLEYFLFVRLFMFTATNEYHLYSVLGWKCRCIPTCTPVPNSSMECWVSGCICINWCIVLSNMWCEIVFLRQSAQLVTKLLTQDLVGLDSMSQSSPKTLQQSCEVRCHCSVLLLLVQFVLQLRHLSDHYQITSKTGIVQAMGDRLSE
jgi:hypothetical protein